MRGQLDVCGRRVGRVVRNLLRSLLCGWIESSWRASEEDWERGWSLQWWPVSELTAPRTRRDRPLCTCYCEDTGESGWFPLTVKITASLFKM